ncbi:MAG: hypothetical protein NT069_17640 [Planctomycetota bacterium]|nr:hypothetical protein [Planctomycetota bacterium]
MSKLRKNKRVDEPGVLAGVPMPPTLAFYPTDDEAGPDDELGRRIFRLLKLHPEVCVQFRLSDLDAMDDATKRLLIADVKSTLVIKPLKGYSA